MIQSYLSYQIVTSALIPYYKKCRKCSLDKIITDFRWGKNGNYYYWSNVCKVCDNKRRGKYYHAVEKNELRKTEEWYKKNKKSCRKYYWKNVKVLGKKWNESTRRNYRHWCDQYNRRRRKLYRLYPERFREKNPLRSSIRQGVSESLKGNKNGRCWEGLVGYTLQDLKIHLEKQFKSGMNWENYGTWHVDHIKPQSSFSFIRAEDPEFLKCRSLKNLQPLWASENYSKGARILEDKEML